MKTLVTGGTGFIGSHLVAELLRRGYRIRVLVRPGDSAPESWKEAVEVVRGDIRDYHSLLNAMEGCDRLFHLAANPNLWARDVTVFESVNYHGTLNVLRAARELGTFKKIVYTSSATILAPPRKQGEALSFFDSRLDAAGPYCMSKLMAARAVAAECDSGLPAVIVCPTMPIGPGDHNMTPPTRMLLDYLNGRIKAVFNCNMNIVDVADAAIGHIEAEQKGTVGGIYLLGATNLSLAELFQAISRVSGLPAPKFRIPYVVALAVAYASELMADYVTGKPPMASVTGVKLAERSYPMDNARTLRELGISFRPLETTIARAVKDLVERSLVNRRIRLKDITG